VEEAFQAACRRLVARIDGAIDELFRFSSELFAVPYEAVRATPLWVEESQFSYKFWSAPPSLYMMASAAIRALPRAIANPIILRRVRESAVDSARMQSGRVRHDLAQRLDASRQAFAAKVSATTAAAIDGLDAALGESAQARRRTETESGERKQALAASLRRLESARAQIERLVRGPAVAA
jgi:hypothetical protein